MEAHTHGAVAGVDATFLFIFGVSAAILVMIVAAMIYFVIRYRRDRHPVAADIDGNLFAEVVWTVLPTLLVLAMFHFGWTSYRALRDAPPGAMPVKVEARMWSWKFTYENGRTSDTLVVPVGRPVALSLTATDVIHGFFVPAFRIKIDTVPGMTTHAWFVAEKPGEHDIFCSVYCGLKHADMRSFVRAVAPEEFETWLAEKPRASVPRGKMLMEQNGCLGCHSLDGTASVGPSLKDIAGRTVVLVGKDGKETTLTADAAYLRQAISGSGRGLVKGFDPVMPSYAGVLSEEDVSAIAAFLMGAPETPKADGAALAEREGCTGCHSLDGSAAVGPSFKGLFGSTATVVEQGKDVKVKVDRDYVTGRLLDPEAKRTKGYPPVMPAYGHLSPAEREALADYLEGLGGGK